MAKEGFKDGICNIRDGWVNPEKCLHPSELLWGSWRGVRLFGARIYLGSGKRLWVKPWRQDTVAQWVFGCVDPWSGEGSCHLLDEAGQVDVSLR